MGDSGRICLPLPTERNKGEIDLELFRDVANIGIKKEAGIV
jgi:hypothetical protein